LVNEFDVLTPSIHFEAGKLSGGNLQKVVLGRELLARPTALVVEHPTRGLDVGATEYVHRQLLAERSRGAALLLISAELEEILALSDRIAVLYQGEIMGVLTAGAQDPNSQIELLGLMMAGSPLASLFNLHTPGRSDGPHG
jgi:simple sugar transport system ATP-binding protein